MKYLTKNIFLDTNIYEKNNFFQSSNIQSLFYYSRIGIINLHMTHISKMELIDRMKKRVIEIKDEHNKFVKSLNRSRILRNLHKYETVEKSTITVTDVVNELSRKLETIIHSSQINLISAYNIDVDAVFDLYYNQEPPFSSKERKKYEFPDAFIIKAVESWCLANKKKMIFLTKDNDFGEYKSSRIIFRHDLTELLGKITLYYDSLQKHKLLPAIKETLKRNKNELLSLIKNEIDRLILIDLDFEKISNLSWEVGCKKYQITSIRPEYAEITYVVRMNVKYTIIPNQIDIKKSIFEDNVKPIHISQHLDVPCDLEIYFDKKNNIQLKWINSNQKILIRYE